MLFTRRQRLRRLAEREASGESFWTDHFDEPARVKVKFAFDDCTGSGTSDAADIAHSIILRDEGVTFLQDRRVYPYEDLLGHLQKCDDDFVPTIIEAMYIGVRARPYSEWGAAVEFEKMIRLILREHRVNFDFISGQIVPLDSLELHEAVVVPTLTLLAGRRDFGGAEEAYLEALKEISKNNPANAITDAGTALQETLVALGCEGNALGPLIKSAKSKSLLASHDKTLTDGIEKMAHWVSADRSEMGDAHKVGKTTVEDAWLTVHVVGALIVRLSESSGRGE